MVLRYSWHACERVRVRSRRKTRFSASASVWNQLAAAGGAVSAIEHPADGATGGARGRLVLKCSWHACERVRRAQSGSETRLSAPASVWNQPKSPQSHPQSSTRPMAPLGALGGALCSGARGTLVSVCGALRAGLRLDSVHPRASGTSRSRHISAIEHVHN